MAAVRPRAWILAAGVTLAGCGWDVPRPNVRHDAAADALEADARGDGGGDAPPADVSPDVGMDAPARTDLGTDLGTDASTGTDAPGDTGGTDAPVDAGGSDGGGTDAPVDVGGSDGGGTDAPADVGVSDGGGCVPGARRPCYSGSAGSRDQGVCREGVQVCDRTGAWPTDCAGEILPDCTARMCGGDECSGTCGPPCPDGTVCDDAGRCVTRTCGPDGFTVACPDGTHCPAGAMCSGGGRCTCNPGTVAVDCGGTPCGATCAYPMWLCAPAPFCGAGSVLCASGVRCPRHSGCDPVTGACRCNAGYAAVTCAGMRCDTCAGTDYRCVALPLP